MGPIAAQEGVSPESVLAYPGSSIALHHAVLAFTGPRQPLITASPGYEAAAKAAEYIGAQVVKVPLRADGSHDLETMTAAAGRVGAGLIYVCSPNNPTGSITPKAEIDRLIANKPAGSVVLIDEAYIHFSEQPSSRDHVAAGRDVVVLRTFSKIYGMAGLRAGFVMARPDLLEMAKGFTAGALPATAMAAARAMLEDPDVVPQRRTLAKDIRQDLCGFFDAKGFEYAPSESFKVIVDTRLPVEKVIAGMKERQVFVGRPWPEWPTHLRVSLGSVEDMAKFKSGFLAVVGS